MKLLDTDILTLLFQGHDEVKARLQSAEDEIATTIMTWIEILQGRFDAIRKAAGGDQLLIAQHRLQKSQEHLANLPLIGISPGAGAEFDNLLRNKKLKKLRRGDLIIASIVLAQNATLVTRNINDFKLIPRLKLENWAD